MSKNIRFLSAIILALSALSLYADRTDVPKLAPIIKGMDLQQAKSFCNSHPLRGPMGIYLWPDKSVLVLVRQAPAHNLASLHYELIVVESENILYQPGQVIGYLFPSSSPQDYTAVLYSKAGMEGLRIPKKSAAKYNESDQTFRFENRKTHFSVNPLALIPRLRSLVHIKTDNPLSEIPDGLQHVYPSSSSGKANTLTYPRYF